MPAVIIDLTSTSRKQANNSFAYVPLSRVESLEHLAILQHFPIEAIRRKKTLDHEAQDRHFSLMDKNVNGKIFKYNNKE